MDEKTIELAEVFRLGFSDYAIHQGSLPAQHYRVVNALLACHTSALGGHVYRCEQCGHEKISYNSCRNRHCPSCQATARARWVDQRMKELLPVPYFHVVFTVPARLNPFALRNKEMFYNILFQSASETLHTLAGNPKRLGAKIGFIAILHAWGQNLLDHPHLHCVVPAGGLAADGSRWKKIPHGNFLFPVKVMSALFRGKFLDLFKAAVCKKEILFHGALEEYQNPREFSALLDSLYESDWVVYAKAPFAGPKAVLKYLGRYTHRIAIANARLVQLTDTHVSFTWKDYADGNRKKVMTLTHVEFIRRFLLHIVPRGFVRIRYYGFLSQAAKKEKLAQCMKLLGQKLMEPLIDDIDKKAWDILLKELRGEDPWKCPLCNKGRLVPHREIPRPQRSVCRPGRKERLSLVA
jgi:hypothetical protein